MERRRSARNAGLLALAGAALAAAAWSAAPQSCRVLDPELQDAYAGPCVNGLADGEGYARGRAEYRGGFKSGMKHGKGVKSWPNGDRYEGAFVDDRKEGQGVYVYGRGPWQGERYEGGFLADKRHGFGVYRWPTGDVYRGPWENDVGIGPPTPMMVARAKFEQEARGAFKPGDKACKEVVVGIGGRDWIRGVVVQAAGNAIAVRIEDAGSQQHFVGDTPIRAGSVLRDPPTAWLPCY